MAGLTDYERLRRDVGADEDALSNTSAAEIFAEAAELYTGTASRRCGTRVLALQGMLAIAAKETDYSQDTTQERASQLYDHLKDLLEHWQGELDKALLDELNASGRFTEQSRNVQVQAVW